MVGAGQTGAEVAPIPSAAFTLGYPGGGGQHLMLVNMQQPLLTTTHPIHLTDGDSY